MIFFVCSCSLGVQPRPLRGLGGSGPCGGPSPSVLTVCVVCTAFRFQCLIVMWCCVLFVSHHMSLSVVSDSSHHHSPVVHDVADTWQTCCGCREGGFAWISAYISRCYTHAVQSVLGL